MIKKVLKECIPTIFSLTLLGFYAIIDGLFIGNTVGDLGLSAINIAWPITALIMAVGVGTGIGASVLISHARGRGDTQSAQGIFHVSFTLLLIFSGIIIAILLPTHSYLLELLGAKGEVLLQAKNYIFVIVLGCPFQIIGSGLIPILRNHNMPLGAMLTMVTGTIINLGANAVFIVFLEFGIMGAALGTIVAQSIVLIIGFTLLRKKAGVKIKFALDLKVIKNIIKTGTTSFGLSLAPSLTLMFTNFQCLSYGGDTAVAAYSVISYIAFPAQSMLSGIGDGTQPLISFYTGAKEDNSLKKVLLISRIMNVVLGAILSFTVVLVTPYMGNLFGLSDLAKSYFESGMIIYALAFIVMGFVKLNLSYLNSTLNSKKASVLTYLECLLISPLLLFIFPPIFGLIGIWLSYPISAVIMITIYFLSQIHFRTKNFR